MRASFAAAFLLLLAGCAAAEAPAPLLTVAETESRVQAMFEAGAVLATQQESEAAINARCREAGYLPGTVEHGRCRLVLKEEALALEKAAALARIGQALARTALAPDSLEGRRPELAKSLYCYAPDDPALVPCQDL